MHARLQSRLALLLRLVLIAACALTSLVSTARSGMRELSRLMVAPHGDSGSDGVATHADDDDLGEADLVARSLTAPSPRALRQVSGSIEPARPISAPRGRTVATPRPTLAQRLPTPPPRLLL